MFQSIDLGTELLTSFNSQHLLRQLLRNLQQDNKLELPQLIEMFQEVKQEYNIPLSIFSTKTHLHPAEALSFYLTEEQKLSYQEIAKLLNRNEKSIWATSQRVKKRKLKLVKLNQKEKYFLPLSIFQNRSYSLLESAILHLNQVYHLSNKEISQLLQKSPNSIAVLLKRAKEIESKQKINRK